MRAQPGLLKYSAFYSLWWFWLACILPCAAKSTPVGADIEEVFARARQGSPLRYVALGGSITQSGEGWIGNWLAQQFPKSTVTAVNSGMSGTGSQLAIFRVERDVIVHQPDLVAIEFCVNDENLDDEETVRCMESLVVRLKQLPHPPAILIVEAATRNGSNLKRHRQVAQQYGLLEVDLQAAVDQALQKKGGKWENWFRDRVHPNEKGNEFYTQAIINVLNPCLRSSFKPSVKATRYFPQPISRKPLILDGRLVPLSSDTSWKREPFLPRWWGRFFSGVLCAEAPGSALTLPLRGTAFGLFYEMDPSYGSFLAAVDGGPFTHVLTNTREGYSYEIIDQDLSAKEHLLQVVLPASADPGARLNGPVKLGYVLVAGESHASRERASMGSFTVEKLQQLVFRTISAQNWGWTGYQPVTGQSSSDALALLNATFSPETVPLSEAWQKLPYQTESWIDLRQITGRDQPGIIYLSTEIESSTSRDILFGIAVDYFAKVWINGTLALTLDRAHGAPKSYTYFPSTLKAGKNHVLLKVAAGRAGFGFSFVSVFTSQ